ncbi:MAG: SMC-Scp complex subunit ScpB [Planctomycetota bacterium]
MSGSEETAVEAEDRAPETPEGEEASLPGVDERPATDEVVEADGAPAEAVEPWAEARIQAVVEALLFASPEPLTFRAIRDVVPEDAVTTSRLREALDALRERHDHPASGIRLAQIAGGFWFQTHEDVYEAVQSLAKTRVEDRVSPAALETLAIVAYKQPITRAEIDAIRGVGSGSLIRTLMDKKMVKVVGRVDLPGRPFQYGTTAHFLEHFGLGNLKDLPQGREL